MFDLLNFVLDTIMNVNTNELYKGKNEAHMVEDSLKTQADKTALVTQYISNEQDPLKKEKMCQRLMLGITDFSDL
jgi:hypothetical protein